LGDNESIHGLFRGCLYTGHIACLATTRRAHIVQRFALSHLSKPLEFDRRRNTTREYHVQSLLGAPVLEPATHRELDIPMVYCRQRDSKVVVFLVEASRKGALQDYCDGRKDGLSELVRTVRNEYECGLIGRELYTVKGASLIAHCAEALLTTP
jgi:hypothetical protein